MDYNLHHINKPWETPELTGINRLPSRATLYPFQSIDTAKTFDRSESSWFSLLSGNWKFKLYDSPEEVDSHVLTEGTDSRLWRDIIESVSGTDQDFTEGKLGRAILLLSIPMVLEMTSLSMG